MSANVYTNIMPCNRNNTLHSALPEVYFAIVSNLGDGELSSFSSSRAPIRGNVELQIVCLSSSPTIDAILLPQALLHLLLLGEFWGSIPSCLRTRRRCERDSMLRTSINLFHRRGNARRLRKTTPRRHTVSLTLSQALGRAIPGRLRGRNRGLGLHPAATRSNNAAVSTVDPFPSANALRSDSIDAVLVRGERACRRKERQKARVTDWQERQRQGKCLVGGVALECRVQLQGRRGRAERRCLWLGVMGYRRLWEKKTGGARASSEVGLGICPVGDSPRCLPAKACRWFSAGATQCNSTTSTTGELPVAMTAWTQPKRLL